MFIVILGTVRSIAPGEVRSLHADDGSISNYFVIQWKVFVQDRGSKRILDGVVLEDDILEANITSVPYHLSLE